MKLHESNLNKTKIVNKFKNIENEFRELHGDKYDYSEFVYLTYDSLSTIICPIHGAFQQSYTVHKRGCGCQKCGTESCHNLQKSNTKEFIEKAIIIHGDTYDYSKVIYKTTKENVIITCNVHGDFKQISSTHLSGAGCRKCYDSKRANEQRKTTEQFIAEAKEIHKNKYDYSLVKYKTTHSKVKIICFYEFL